MTAKRYVFAATLCLA